MDLFREGMMMMILDKENLHHTGNYTGSVNLLEQVNNRIRFLDNVQEIRLRERLCLCSGNSVQAEIDGVVYMVPHQILQQGVR